jgi:hypothetical protein
VPSSHQILHTEALKELGVAHVINWTLPASHSKERVSLFRHRTQLMI